MRKTGGLIVLVVVLAATGPAAAHGLQVFAMAKGAAVEGEVFHAGGEPAPDVPVRLETPQGETLAETRSDAQGAFRFPVEKRRAVRVVAETASGHAATWSLKAEAFPGDLPRPDRGGGKEKGGRVAATRGAVKAAVREAVAAEVAPLRRDLERLRERTRWRDVAGGVGWIVGLFGVAFFVAARRR